MGSYAAGLRNGRGTLRYPDGSTCEAIWVDGVAKGKGRLVDAGGSVYEGELLEGVMFSGPRVGTGKASWISPLKPHVRTPCGVSCQSLFKLPQ